MKKDFLKINFALKNIILIIILFFNSNVNLYSTNIYDNQVGIQYNISADPVISGNYVLLKVYIQSTGDDFYLGMSSLGIVYDSTVFKYDTFIEESTILFSNNSQKGYKQIESNPHDSVVNKIPNLRIIDIRFDTTTKPKPTGLVVPKTNTYLGTLKFQILKKNSIFKFSWHPSTIIRTVNNSLITALCEKKQIKDFIIYKANIIAPIGGESFYPGKKYDIKWNSTASYPLYVQYSNNGTDWANLESKTILSAKAIYNWTIPIENSASCYIRLQDSASKFVLSQSEAFSIFEGFAQLIRPSSGDALYVAGKTDYIKWTAQGYGKVKFEVSTDGGDTWKLVAGPTESSLGQVAWKIPSVTTKSAQVRMIDYELGTIIATSGKFKIIQGNIVFKNPISNELVNYNKTYRIRWTGAGINTFDMDYSTDAGKNWNSLATTVNAALGYYDWNVPQIDSKIAVIRAIWNGDPEMEFGKSGTFTLRNPVGVDDFETQDQTLISPNPANDYIKITLDSPSIKRGLGGVSLPNIEIFNIFGEKVEQTSLSVNTSQTMMSDLLKIDISNLSSGVYFIKIGDKFEKFVKL